MRQGGRDFNAALWQAANATGACRLDFHPVGGFLEFGVDTVEVQMIPQNGIDAYWVPYQGNRILFRFKACDNSFEDISGKGRSVSFSSDIIFNRSVS